MQFIHYLPRRVVLRVPESAADPWFRRFLRRQDGFEQPVRHSTRQQTGAAVLAKGGDCIWIVSQVFSPWGALPPGIDACIEVASRQRRSGGGFHYSAGPGSRWFPLMDATALLSQLVSVDERHRHAPLWADPQRPVGHSLQSMRRLDDAHALLDWEASLAAKPLHFVSYRIADGTKRAFEQVGALLRQGEKVFWDRWGLPRRLAERRERVDDRALDEHLMRQLASAQVVWGIETPGYFDPAAYAARECALARQRGTYRSLP